MSCYDFFILVFLVSAALSCPPKNTAKKLSPLAPIFRSLSLGNDRYEQQSLQQQLRDAVVQKDVRTVRRLLFQGVPPVDSIEPSLLHIATFNGWVDITKMLLGRGAAKKMIKDRLLNALVHAVYTGFVPYYRTRKIIKILDEYGAFSSLSRSEQNALKLMTYRIKLCYQKYNNGNSYLHKKVLEGDSDEVINILIKEPSIINLKNNVGKTALVYAVESKNIPIIDLLLEAGADPTVCDADGWTAKKIAYESGYHEIAQKLIRQEGWLRLKKGSKIR